MAFQVFGVLGSLGKCGDQIPLRLPRTPQTWKTIGICMVFIDFELNKLEKILEYLCFLFLCYEKVWTPLDYVRLPMLVNRTAYTLYSQVGPTCAKCQNLCPWLVLQRSAGTNVCVIM